MHNLAQLVEDAKDCRYFAAALGEEIKGGGDIDNCKKLARALSERSAKLDKVFTALESATNERKGN